MDIEIPERLKRFPLYKGMLVHFTVFVGDDGVPDFKVVHEWNRMICMRDRLCALCGQKFEKEMVFIGGEKTIHAGIFIDGPQHSECALYAIKVCPYLKNETWEHSKLESKHKKNPNVVLITFENVPISRPRMGVYYTDGYEIILDRNNHRYYKASPAFYVDWDLMPQPGAKEKKDE